MDLLWFRHVVKYMLVAIVEKGGDVLQSQPFVLGDLYVPNILGLNT